MDGFTLYVNPWRLQRDRHVRLKGFSDSIRGFRSANLASPFNVHPWQSAAL
jgi:hypothetical protein